MPDLVEDTTPEMSADDAQLLARLAPVAETAQASLRMRVKRVRGSWRAIVQSALAAGLAWWLARLIVGAPDPFFAPAAAVISIGLARGQPLRRSAEVAVGVALGIAIAFLLRSAIGLGPVQIGAIMALTIVAALLVDASVLLVNQAAISAVLVITLPSAGLSAGPDRFFDAMIGGGVALLVSQIVFVRHPTNLVANVLGRTLSELATAIREGAEALEHDSLEQAVTALERLRGLDGDVARLFESLATAREAASLLPTRRRVREQLEPVGDAARQIDYAVRNARVLLRAIASALRTRAAVNPELVTALATLAATVDALADQLGAGDDPSRMRTLAVQASEQATEVLALQHDLRTTMIIGQIRATAVDLLRASGLDSSSSRDAIPAAPSEDM
jgi:uncharacterized membrane protein YgaE (UPF0421/DUF939 family)